MAHNLYGANDQPSGDDVGDTIVFGDVRTETKPSGLSTLAQVGLAAAGGGVTAAAIALASYLLLGNDDVPEPPQPTHSETVSDYEIGEIVIE